eukprot:COSAG01_NODE_9564_length_2408_cov_5.157211_3_plen_90_part_00
MFQQGARGNPIFCNPNLSWYLLPCLAVTAPDDPTKSLIVWTHTRARRRGLGRKLVEQLRITSNTRQLEGSKEFWKACGLEGGDKPCASE